ncbi:hypothetical protein POM88_023115 [Heracleum sosnowskyi]|uniref:Uncharacterized protein n=1 Tax=Heracleum sosnowskyi TaxID=360622 RepID=A0AAD8MQ75_9APIA|nr:hypothetical protein POM88_023115 [Heracleum sosnowskyi]
MDIGSNALTGSKHGLEINIQLPIHARYPPIGDRGYSRIQFGQPYLFTRCSVEGKSSNQNCIFMSTDSTAQASDNSIVWEVPSGDKKYATTVSFFTFMSAILSALSIVLVSIHHSNFETDDNKQSQNCDLFCCQVTEILLKNVQLSLESNLTPLGFYQNTRDGVEYWFFQFRHLFEVLIALVYMALVQSPKTWFTGKQQLWVLQIALILVEFSLLPYIFLQIILLSHQRWHSGQRFSIRTLTVMEAYALTLTTGWSLFVGAKRLVVGDYGW